MNDLLYRKVGRRYHPVSMYGNEVADALPKGAHLIIIDDGWRSCRYNINPDHAAVLAALRMNREACMQAMRKASASRPTSRPLTPLERKAYKAYADVMGAEGLMQLEMCSAADVVDALERSLIEQTNPTDPNKWAFDRGLEST